MESFVEGFKLMIPAIGILIFAWTLKGMGDALQIGTFVESIVGTSASASLFLPAVLFVVAVFLAFSTGTSWGTFAILVPIAIAMFPGADHLEDDHCGFRQCWQVPSAGSYFTDFGYNGYVFGRRAE